MSEEPLPQPVEVAPTAEADQTTSSELEPHVLEPELLERVEEAARLTAIMAVKHEMHSGPMPSPKQLAEYERILPGSALVIRDEFQANSRHIRAMEDRGQAAMIQNDVDNRSVAERLVWAAFALILVLALTNHESVAISLAVTTVIGIVSGFLTNGRKPNQQKQNESTDS